MTTRRDMLKLGLVAPWLSACGGGGSGSRTEPDPPNKGSEQPIRTSIPADDWTVASPESQAIAAALMQTLLEQGASLPFLYSMLVVRNGLLVGERYYGDARSSDLRSLASVTKTVSSLLIGQAIAEGKITGTADTLRTLLPNELAKTPNSFAADISLQHLLDMCGGQTWDESVRQRDATTARDMTAFVLALPGDRAPGTTFRYSTAASHLMSPILRTAYGMDELALAKRNLFAPLGIAQTAWSTDASGMIHGSFGLQMRTRDLMKLAWMALDGGQWNGRSIVPASWLVDGHASHVKHLGNEGALLDVGYGNLWWSGTMAGHAVSLAWGYGGQFALLVPSLRIAIATASELNVSYATAGSHEQTILNLVGSFLAGVKV